VTTPAEWRAELERHWDYFEDAGWLENVTYYPFSPASDEVSSTGAATVAVVDTAVKRERPGPDEALTYVEARDMVLRASDLGDTTVTIRGVIERAGGDRWQVEDAELRSDDNDYRVSTVRIA
jgi:post-segregation antitoxin (ccd killing protein)